MALKAEIYKTELEVVDMDRNHYETYKLTIACHPSETLDRMMLRLLAYALDACEGLVFGKGVSDSEEPDLWLKDYEGRIRLWVELGHPEEKILAKALKQADLVKVYTFSTRPALWWEPLAPRFAQEKKLQVIHVDAAAVKDLGALAEKGMSIQVSVQDGAVTVRNAKGAQLEVGMERLG